MSHPVLDSLRRRLGPDAVLTAEAAMVGYIEEPRRRWTTAPLAVVRPKTTAEVAALVRLCRDHRVPIIPRGGGTGTVGGASATATRCGIVVSLDRMRAIRALDPAAATLTAEAGLALDAARAAAHEHGLEVPLWLASGGSATLGGITATNAGGNTTIRYGNARRMILGVEAVLADGRVLDRLSGLRKDNTGYDLVGLLVGSEGTLGILTAVTLGLVPEAKQRVTAWCGVDSPAAALRLLRRARQGLGETLTAFELLPRFALELVLQHLPGARDPLAPETSPWSVLLEADSAVAGDWLETAAVALLSAAAEGGEIGAAVLARTPAEAQQLWRLREAVSPAQKHAGASIKHDISVPIATIPDMIAAVLPQLKTLVPGIRPCVFGHVGDGNLHFNLSRPAEMDDASFMAREAEINRIVFDRVQALGGSIAAEHGIGQLRRDELERRADPVRLDLLRRIKQALDPEGLLNPGKLIDLGNPIDNRTDDPTDDPTGPSGGQD